VFFELALSNPMVVLKILVALKAAHFVGDFAWQSTWMAMEKGKSWTALVAHSATYTSAFVVLGLVSPVKISLLGLAVYLVSHVVIDALKARWNLIGSIWLDQVCHTIIHLIVVAIGAVVLDGTIF
jgi:hypothetical protein